MRGLGARGSWGVWGSEDAGKRVVVVLGKKLVDVQMAGYTKCRGMYQSFLNRHSIRSFLRRGLVEDIRSKHAFFTTLWSFSDDKKN